MILQILGIIVGILIGAFILELAMVALVPGVSAAKQRLKSTPQTAKQVAAEPSYLRKDVSFNVKGTSLSAWLYLPANFSAPLACIIMGHGFGGTKDMGLEPYAVRFQAAGFAVLIFDYRHGQRDLVRSWLGLSAHKIPIVGKPGSIACITSPDAYTGYTKLSSQNFINEACARIVLRGDKYRPVKQAKNVRCPVLLQICENDSLTPLSAAQETKKQLGNFAEAIHYPIGHFDIYTGPNFERSVSDQLAFFMRHL